jgi:hypothetical protein
MAFLKESKKLEIKYKLAMELGEIEIPNNIKYYYITLIRY